MEEGVGRGRDNEILRVASGWEGIAPVGRHTAEPSRGLCKNSLTGKAQCDLDDCALESCKLNTEDCICEEDGCLP